MPIRKASANWHGTLSEGRGAVHLPAAHVDAPYSFQSRFESGNGTNPEELLGAAHAGCFSMALAHNLSEAGHPPESVDTEAQVHLEKVEGGFEIPRIHLVSRVKANGIAEADFARIADETKKTCPLSKVLAGARITLDARLEA